MIVLRCVSRALLSDGLGLLCVSRALLDLVKKQFNDRFRVGDTSCSPARSSQYCIQVLAVTGTNAIARTARAGHLLRTSVIDCELAGKSAPLRCPLSQRGRTRDTCPRFGCSSSPATSSRRLGR